MSLLSAPITLSKIAIGAALLGGDALVAAGRKAGSAATSGAGAAVVMAGSAGNELTAIGAAVIGTLGEAVGGPPVRRRSSTATTRWIRQRDMALSGIGTTGGTCGASRPARRKPRATTGKKS